MRKISRLGMVLFTVAASMLGGCSILYDTGDLEGHDAGVGDSSTGDSGMGDTAAGDSGMRDSNMMDSNMMDSSTGDSGTGDSGTGDSGLVDSSMMDSGPPPCDDGPMPTGITWDDHGNATVSFDTTSSSPTNYELDLGGDVTPLTLPMGRNSATKDGYFIPLVRSTDTLTIRRTDRSCSLDVMVGTTMDVVPKPAGTSILTASHTASMDIANNGTVVFFQRPAGFMGDDLDPWPMGDAVPTNLVRTMGTSSPRDWGAGPRISDDGALIVYWRGDYDSAAPDAGQFHYIYTDGTDTRHPGDVTPRTAYVTSDLRAPAGAGGPYGFALRGSGGNARLVQWTTGDLSMSTTGASIDLGFAGAGPALHPFGSMRMSLFAYLEPGATPAQASPRRVGVSNTGVIASSTTPATGCTVDRGVGVTAIGTGTGADGRIAFVGVCGGTMTPQLHVGDPTELNFSTTGASHYDVPPDVDGLLAADDSLTHFLIRQAPDAGASGKVYILAPDSGVFPLVDEVGTAAPILTTLFDAAALSPDGHWAVYPTHSSGAGPVTFDLVRIRVY